MDMKFEVLMAVTMKKCFEVVALCSLIIYLYTLKMEPSGSSKSIPPLFLVTFH